MFIHLVVYTVSAFPPPGNMNTVKFTKDQHDWHQPQPIFQTLRGLLCMWHGLSVQLSKVTRVLPGPPFPVVRLGLLSVCLGRIWQARAGPGSSRHWPPACAGGVAVNPQACLAPWGQLVCAWAAFEAYSQVTEEITFPPVLPRATSGLLLFPWASSPKVDKGAHWEAPNLSDMLHHKVRWSTGSAQAHDAGQRAPVSRGLYKKDSRSQRIKQLKSIAFTQDYFTSICFKTPAICIPQK